MGDPTSKLARPASVDDLKLLLGALNEHGVDYLLIGGYALYALGYQRGTVDIDLVLRPTREQGEKVMRALLLLPDGVAKDIDPDWFVEGETIRVADAFVVDLMFNACGETFDSLLPHAITIELDGVPVRTLDIEGLLKPKQSARAGHRDRVRRAGAARLDRRQADRAGGPLSGRQVLQLPRRVRFRLRRRGLPLRHRLEARGAPVARQAWSSNQTAGRFASSIDVNSLTDTLARFVKTCHGDAATRSARSRGIEGSAQGGGTDD